MRGVRILFALCAGVLMDARSAFAQGDLLDDAGRALLKADPVLGAVIFFLGLAVVWLTKQWLKKIDELVAEKEAHRNTTKDLAILAVEMKNAVAANTGAVQAVGNQIQSNTLAVQGLSNRTGARK